MNPELRITLIQSLENIKYYHGRNFASRYWKIGAWFGIVVYVVLVLLFIFSDKENKSLFILFLYLPVPISSMWLLFRSNFDKKYKLLADAILEIEGISEHYLTHDLQEQVIVQTSKPSTSLRRAKAKIKKRNR